MYPTPNSNYENKTLIAFVSRSDLSRSRNECSKDDDVDRYIIFMFFMWYNQYKFNELIFIQKSLQNMIRRANCWGYVNIKTGQVTWYWI